ncbi:putative rTX toxin, partial [Vibrio parahaemolyticus V-223/04]
QPLFLRSRVRLKWWMANWCSRQLRTSMGKRPSLTS